MFHAKEMLLFWEVGYPERIFQIWGSSPRVLGVQSRDSGTRVGSNPGEPLMFSQNAGRQKDGSHPRHAAVLGSHAFP